MLSPEEAAAKAAAEAAAAEAKAAADARAEAATATLPAEVQEVLRTHASFLEETGATLKCGRLLLCFLRNVTIQSDVPPLREP